MHGLEYVNSLIVAGMIGPCHDHHTGCSFKDIRTVKTSRVLRTHVHWTVHSTLGALSTHHESQGMFITA